MATITSSSTPTANTDSTPTKRFVDLRTRVVITGGPQTSRAKIERAVAKAADAILEAFKSEGMNQARLDPDASTADFNYGPWLSLRISE